ncbi:SpaA isopeptide-forming pilin-related protein [Hornefia butyriciproducens]|uniref:SpaA isopeptide-forming pilin-related protein n=1 Tax=Hornefia butyriciproducens TaxID=2652293 RepID=UPI002A916D91|nr:SpaA isopeptide-forming pilin-related protein [Hornefia butyriciproducens]MDY5422672.1 SpaA isopeptide-forming pilin-related protein [Hornefia butyriciproducens]
MKIEIMLRRLFIGLLIITAVILAAAGIYADSAVPEGTAELRDAWYPTDSPVNAIGTAANRWQIVSGNYFDGKQGSTTEKRNSSGSVIVRKNVIPTDTENVFQVALKIRTKASWADALDGTQARVQNGNSDHSSKVDYFNVRPTSTHSVKIYVYYVNAPDNTSENAVASGVQSGRYKVVYRKAYYVNPSISGKMFLYFRNPLIGMGNHGGQKMNITSSSRFYIPIGTTMESYDLLYHAAVAKNVTDAMGNGMQYIPGSVKYKTSIPGVSGKTAVSAVGNTLTWSIDDDGTIPVGEDYKLVKDVVDGKTTYYREYDLVYKVHLDASAADFVAGKTYLTNQNATLRYTYDPRPEREDSDYQDYERGNLSLEFPQPTVKGTLYNLKLRKVDQKTGKPLAGATFTLNGSYGVSEVTPAKSDYSLNGVTDENGYLTFENVPWGRYSLNETEAPYGYNKTYSGQSWNLCYTSNFGILTPQDDEYWLKDSQVGNNGEISNSPWVSAKLTIQKTIDNAEDIRSVKERETAFDIVLKNYDTSRLVFQDSDGNIVTKDELREQLKNGGVKTYTVLLKNGSGSFDLQEELGASEELFTYARTESEVSAGRAGVTAVDNGVHVQINEEDNLKLIIHNRYRTKTVNIHKTDDTGRAELTGAKFALYTGNPEDAGETQDTVEHGGKTYYLMREAETDAKGKIALNGLPAGDRTYLLVETAAPKGYQKLETPVPFRINGDDITLESADVNVSLEGSVFTIQDQRLYKLPNAGGPGIYILMLLGGMLTGLAISALYKRRYGI